LLSPTSRLLINELLRLTALLQGRAGRLAWLVNRARLEQGMPLVLTDLPMLYDDQGDMTNDLEERGRRQRALTAAMESLTDTYAAHWSAIVEADGDAWRGSYSACWSMHEGERADCNRPKVSRNRRIAFEKRRPLETPFKNARQGHRGHGSYTTADAMVGSLTSRTSGLVFVLYIRGGELPSGCSGYETCGLSDDRSRPAPS
jgi:hypothetical protein